MGIAFYFLGHDCEYEARNTLRIFDSNIDYSIKEVETLKDNIGLGLLCSFEENEKKSYTKAFLYLNDKLLFFSQFSSDDIILESQSDKRLKKTLIIKCIYKVLKSYYNITPDYGILTGVRVVKILITALENHKTNEEILEIFRDTYEVKEDKIKLIWDIFNIEKKYLNKEINKGNYNLYIGIPFCPSKCSYCSFTSFINTKEDKVNDYIKTLVYETEQTIKMAIDKGIILNTIYIGGGTPSILNESQINSIFEPLKKYYDLSKVKEITFEAGRPDTITLEKLKCLKSNMVNRISINPQTMNEKTLEKIGRNHSVNDILEKFALARNVGFSSINMDIILGLPGEDEEDAGNTISEIIKLKPENITVHALAYKKKSELTRESHELYKDYDIIDKMHEKVMDECNKNNYMPYYMYRQKNIKGNSENIGFTLSNKEGIYNIIIIEEAETILSCGLGASSKIKMSNGKHIPLINFKSLEEYKNRIDEIINRKKELLNL